MSKTVKTILVFAGTFVAGLVAGATYMALFTDTPDDRYDDDFEEDECAGCDHNCEGCKPSNEETAGCDVKADANVDPTDSYESSED